MAKPLYRFSGRIIGRRRGENAAQHSGAYVSGTRPAVAAAYRYGGKVSCRVDGKIKTFNYSRKLGVVHAELLLPDGAPPWAGDRERLYRNIEWVEDRVNSQFLRELIITLPREIDLEIVKGMLRAWVQRELVGLGMVADICIHAYGTALDPENPKGAERIEQILPPGVEPQPLAPGNDLRTNIPAGPHAWKLPNGKVLIYQPHAHVLLTMREIGPDGFASHKQRDWNSRQLFKHWRKSFEHDYNALLDRQGICARVTSKARWKEVADAARAAQTDPDPYEDNILDDDMLPTLLNLRGGHFAALKGRPPVNGKDGDMMASEANDLLVKDRRLKAAYERRLDRALKRIRELQEAGVSFYRYGEAELRYRGPTELVTRKDVALWDGLHEPILAVLEATPKPAPTVDEQMAAAFSEIKALTKAGAYPIQTATGALDFKDPEGVITEEFRESLRGKEETILREMDRLNLRTRNERLAGESAANAAEAQAAMAANAGLTTKLEEERRSREALENDMRRLVEAGERNEPQPTLATAHPLLRRLKTVIGGLRAHAAAETERANRAEKEVAHLRDALRRVADWVGRRATEIKGQVRKHVEKFLKGGDDIRAGEPPRSVQIYEASPDWAPDARSTSRPPTGDARRPLRAVDATRAAASAEPTTAAPSAPRQLQWLIEDEMGL